MVVGDGVSTAEEGRGLLVVHVGHDDAGGDRRRGNGNGKLNAPSSSTDRQICTEIRGARALSLTADCGGKRGLRPREGNGALGHGLKVEVKGRPNFSVLDRSHLNFSTFLTFLSSFLLVWRVSE